MDPDPQPAQTSRKRRAHKRSRNGCLTCKQRHIRCDELKPVCTNCLTRGGECGYAAESGPSGSGKGVEQHSSKRSIPIIPSSPADPFDSLPIKMPHKSLELFHHFAHYRIFTRTAVPKNPNSQCVGIAFSNPGTFRACLIMAALHYSWIAGPDVLQTGEMEETYLLHKLEAMRLVNEQLADPVRCTSDSCLSLIAALALAESGMGDSLAAQAHLNGLFTLIDMRRPEEWQHRFYGMLQRVILMAGSFVAASKPLTSSPSPSPTSPTTRHPSNLLSTVPLATRLSPFYLTSTPGMEACKADVEGEVLINALTRLTSICYPPSSPDGLTLHPHDPATTAALLKDTDAYVASLLFKPHSLFDDDAPNVQKSFSPDPYRRLPTTLYPSGSRAWATASWLYLHFVLRDLRDQYVEQNEDIDPHLLRLLLDTLKADVEATEAAMQAGTYSVELWGWKVAVGLYVLHVLDEEQDMSVYVESPLDGAIGSDEDDVQMSDVHRVYGSAYSESSDTSSGSDSEEEIGFTGRALRTEGAYIESMKVYFTEKLSIWTYTAKLEDQQAARQLLRKILWPPEDQFDGDAILETVCWNTRGAYSVSESEEGGYETQGSPVIPVDPLLWG